MFGVSCHLIEPGFFRTNILNMNEKRLDALWNVFNGLPEAIKEEYGEQYTKEGEFEV